MSETCGVPPAFTRANDRGAMPSCPSANVTRDAMSVLATQALGSESATRSCTSMPPRDPNTTDAAVAAVTVDFAMAGSESTERNAALMSR